MHTREPVCRHRIDGTGTAAVTCLQTICTGAGKHLVDTDNVERMQANAQVEVVLSDRVDHVLVGGNTSSLKRLGGDLLLLKREEVNAGREHIAANLLFADIVNLDLGVCTRGQA